MYFLLAFTLALQGTGARVEITPDRVPREAKPDDSEQKRG